MTEAEWLASDEPVLILDFLRGKATDRQWRLFAVSALRHVPALMEDEWDQTAVEVAERYADGRATDQELHWVCQAEPVDLFSAKDAVAYGHAYTAACNASTFATGHIREGEAVIHIRPDELAYQAGLLRHLIGNPFNPFRDPATWCSSVVDLAQSLYDGNDNRLILADALEDAGHSELAVHFREEESHPKGCWVVDMILGIL